MKTLTILCFLSYDWFRAFRERVIESSMEDYLTFFASFGRLLVLLVQFSYSNWKSYYGLLRAHRFNMRLDFIRPIVDVCLLLETWENWSTNLVKETNQQENKKKRRAKWNFLEPSINHSRPKNRFQLEMGLRKIEMFVLAICIAFRARKVQLPCAIKPYWYLKWCMVECDFFLT